MQAIETYRQALHLCEGHSAAAVALAKLHLALGQDDKCQEVCTGLLRAQPDNQEAQLMLAELMFSQVGVKYRRCTL